jgi:predicted XRE-type DNA-binding protein
MKTDSVAPSRKLTMSDIMDHREYERIREVRQKEVFEIKRRRRIALGTMITVMFENRQTMQAQIQEMLRVEKVLTDEGVLEELKAYNPLIPEKGQLSATLFIELTTDAQVREWLPKLVGIEGSIAIKLSNGDVVKAIVEEGHAEQLTRENVTAAVHYIRFEFSPEQIDEFAKGEVQVISVLSNYIESTELAQYTVSELLIDLRD